MSETKVTVSVGGLSAALKSVGISATKVARTLSTKDWKFTRLSDDTGVYKEWSGTPVEAFWPTAAGSITYTYSEGLEAKVVPAPTLQSVAVVDPDELLGNYLLIKLDAVQLGLSNTAWGAVEREPRTWRFQFVANSAEAWFCEELGGYLIRLPDLSWAVLCYVG